MQLKRLYIKDYKILKDFTIEFPYNNEKYISVFIGANGSGKSTILEAVAEIFSCLFLQQSPKFDFEIEYSVKHFSQNPREYPHFDVKGKNLLIKITGTKGAPYYIREDDGKGFKSVGINNMDPTNLPSNVVIYYSGLSEIMEKLCKPHEDKLSEAYRKGNTNVDRSFFYYKPGHWGIILLSLLSYEYGDIPEFLKSKARIQGMQSVQIRLKRPSWHKDSIENFWGAEGEVRKFLDYLKEKSQTNKNIDIRANGEERLTIIIKETKILYEAREFLIEERKLFEILNIMLLDGLLDDISFSLLKLENGNYESFIILSEGEQQAITIKGLTELLSGKNSLFIFDEPDTFLHPSWQRQFISEIEKTIEQSFESENSYLIATHSPQLLSNAQTELNFVKIIENGALVEKTPKFYGREISSILYNLMGVEERNETIKKDLSKLFTLIENEETEEAEKELIRLTEILGETDPDIKNAEIQLNYLKEDEANN